VIDPKEAGAIARATKDKVVREVGIPERVNCSILHIDDTPVASMPIVTVHIDGDPQDVTQQAAVAHGLTIKIGDRGMIEYEPPHGIVIRSVAKSPVPADPEVESTAIAWRMTNNNFAGDVESGEVEDAGVVEQLDVGERSVTVGDVTCVLDAPGHVLINVTGYYDLAAHLLLEDFDDSKMSFCTVGQHLDGGSGAFNDTVIAGDPPKNLEFFGGLFSTQPKDADPTILLPNYGEGLQLWAAVEFDNGTAAASADTVTAWFSHPGTGGKLGVPVTASFADSPDGKVTVTVMAALSNALGARLKVQCAGPNDLTVSDSQVTSNAEAYPWFEFYFVKYIGGVTREVLRKHVVNNHESLGEHHLEAPLRLLTAGDTVYVEAVDFSARQNAHAWSIYDLEFAGRFVAPEGTTATRSAPT
jgi:hypothetical protein